MKLPYTRLLYLQLAFFATCDGLPCRYQSLLINSGRKTHSFELILCFRNETVLVFVSCDCNARDGSRFVIVLSEETFYVISFSLLIKVCVEEIKWKFKNIA